MTDTFTVRTVVLALAVLGLVAVIGGIYLVAAGRTVPDFLVAVGSGSIGALGAVLARTSSVEVSEDEGQSRVTVTTDVTSDETKVTEPRRGK